MAPARAFLTGRALFLDRLSLDLARALAALCACAGSNRDAHAGTDPDATAGNQWKTRDREDIQRHHAPRNGRHASGCGRLYRARRSAKLCSRPEVAGAAARAQQNDRGTGESKSAIADPVARLGGDVVSRVCLATFCRPLQHKSEIVARKSWPTGSIALAAQFLRLPNGAAIATSANASQSALLQADMDVDADGSDSDRMPAGSGAPTNFKPFTSYKWGKKTPAPNPYSPAIEERLKRAEDEAALRTTTADRKRDLRAAIAQLREEIATLNKFSFLIGATDPYIVIPSIFSRAGAAKVGDYTVVVFGDRLYPAIIGDIGPNDKTGEASLRIAKEINALSTPYSRPVSDLKVTYLIFPGTAETPFGPPDLDKIQARCQALVDEIGGATVALHHWENIIPPPPTPTPTPTPSPAPSATPGTSTIPSAAPSATFAFPIASPGEAASPTPTP